MQIVQKSVSKQLRKLVYKKLDGHCGYCGKKIEMKEMQVDHMNPRHMVNLNCVLFEGVITDKTNDIENLMPSCRRCNHYKREKTVEDFRTAMKTLHERLEKQYTHKVAIDYAIVEIRPFNGVFYFEK